MVVNLKKKILISIIVLVFMPFTATASFSVSKNNTLLFETKTWSGEIDPVNLAVKAIRNKTDPIMLADCPTKLGEVQNFTIEGQKASWYYPFNDIKVTSFIQDERIILKFETTKAQKLIFPRTGIDKTTKALIYPQGEGLFIPIDDQFWKKELARSQLNTHGELSMPFWGHYHDSGTSTFILRDDLNSTLHILENNNLYIQLEHQFKKIGNYFAPFEINIVLGEDSPIEPSLQYRKYLSEKGELKILKEKSKQNKEIEKLYGAIHIYLWGDGRDLIALNKIKELGINKAWLGYDQDPRTNEHLVTPEFIKTAINSGYLIGPYDSFHTMEDPMKANSINAIFKDLYPSACIINQDNKINIGFGGKGCHLSSEALILQKPPNKTIYDRVDKFKDTGINSYFLDCDATGELFEDYSPIHPMTQEKDRLNRIERMNYISNKKNLVLGSETAAAWSIPFIAFSHGNFSVHNSIHWKFTKSKNYGNWWPSENPAFFFKQVKASDEYIKARYTAQYRLPLFQTVFHDCIITTDRWELSHMKIENAFKERELLELLYGIPSIWSLNLKDISKYGVHLKKLFQFFSPIHKTIATEKIENFKWLDHERKIQQIIFGNKIKLTANFSDKTYNKITPKTIEVKWLNNGKKEYYTP